MTLDKTRSRMALWLESNDISTLMRTLFSFLEKQARNDSVVKAVFDHVRNVGIGSVVMAAGAWKSKHAGTGLMAVWDQSVAVAFALLGLGLIWLNYESLHFKLRGTNTSKWVSACLVALYALILSELLGYLRESRT